ncbi:MAG: hypothetical protein ACTXOO_05745 [Sodalis sp. (in: enterobacteria)]
MTALNFCRVCMRSLIALRHYRSVFPNSGVLLLALTSVVVQ